MASEDDIYEVLFGRKKNHKGEKTFAVSFLDVLRIKEVQLVILACGIKHLANEIAFAKIGPTKKFSDNPHNYFCYFYGGCLALLVCGIFHDTVFNGKSYFLI